MQNLVVCASVNERNVLVDTAKNYCIIDRKFIKNDIEYVVVNQMCRSCMPADPGHWEAVVQARQYVTHMRTFLYLENLIIKHEASNSVVKLKQVNQGLDFFFAN